MMNEVAKYFNLYILYKHFATIFSMKIFILCTHHLTIMLTFTSHVNNCLMSVDSGKKK
jgi:hypothetical protein